MDALDLIAKIKMDISEYEEGLDKAKSKAEKAGGGIGGALSKAASIGGKAMGAMVKVSAAAIGAATAGVGALVTSSVKAYSDYEQLVGGIETLFGAGGKSLQAYADSVGKTADEAQGEYDKLLSAQQTMLDNASNAFRTAGLSANEYMDTAIGFSGALLKSLGGDTEKGAEQTQMAITDMADQANKYGKSVQEISETYTSLARGNTQTLDNLFGGMFAGTKAGLQDMLTYAENYRASLGETVSYSADSYADIVSAIHDVSMATGVYGTTAEEASTTIQGSLGMMKSAWENLVTGLSDKNADVGQLIGNLVDSVVGYTEVTTNGVATHVNGFLDNVIPVIEQALEGIGTLVERLVPQALKLIPSLMNSVIPDIITAGINLATGLVSSITDNLGTITEQINTLVPILVQALVDITPQLIEVISEIILALAGALNDNAEMITEGAMAIVDSFITTFLGMLPELLDLGLQIIVKIADGISKSLPQMIPTIVDIVMKIVDVILQNLPMIIQVALQIVVAIIQGITAALPQLISYVPTIIDEVAGALMTAYPLIAETGGQLILALFDAIFTGATQSLAQIPNIVTSLANAFVGMTGEMLKAGQQLINGLWNGIVGRKSWIIGQLKAMGHDLIDAVKSMFKINSPSKVFEEIGGYLGEGLGLGWSEEMKEVNKQIDKDIHYKGDIDMTTNVNSTQTVKTAEKTISASELQGMMAGMQFNFAHTTEIDGKTIHEDSYKYSMGRMTDDTRNLRIAHGGAY